MLLLSERKYAEVAERFAPVMEEFDASSLAVSIDNKLLELGKFESFSSEKVTGGSSEKAGDFATAILVCIYENGKAKYTISFDKDEQICGLYMK